MYRRHSVPDIHDRQLCKSQRRRRHSIATVAPSAPTIQIPSRKPFELPVACLVRRKDYRVIESLFAEYDIDQDGRITRTEFEEMSMQAFDALPLFSKEKARERLAPHLSTMWDSLSKSSQDGITMPQLLRMFYPRISKHDIARCIKAYSARQRPSKSKTLKEKLRAVPGATEELQEMFTYWDKDGDGVVTWTGLSSPLRRAGVSVETAKGWLREARNKETKMDVSETSPEDHAPLRSSDEMTFDDAAAVFSSNYIMESPIPCRVDSRRLNPACA